MALTSVILVTGGCGSPNHTTAASTQTAAPLLQGDAAHRAAILAGYQGFASGIAYPLTALKLVSPAGSAILTSGKAASITNAQTSGSHLTFGSLSSAFRAQSTTRQFSAANLTFVPALNLYSGDSTFSGNVLTLYYFSDALGTQSAGTMTMTMPSNVSGSNPDYPSYPAKVNIVVNLTAGNLPCNGTIVINFTRSSGKNTMTGTLSLPKSGTTYTVDLTLSDSFDISGSITGQENGATISLTNCSGNLFGTLNCDLTIAPYGWKGTATGSFVTGQFSTMVDTSSGISSSTVDASGDLVISYPDGTTETVTDPLVASLVASGATPTPTPTPSPTPSPTSTAPVTYNAPVSLGPVNPTKINNNGQIVAYRNADLIPLYFSNSASAATVLQGGTGPAPGLSGSDPQFMINDSGQIIASPALYWSSPEASVVSLTGLGTSINGFSQNASSINSSGLIVGGVNDTNGNYHAAYWTGPSNPVVLTAYPNDSDDFALAVNAGGQLVGQAYINNTNTLIYWSSTSATPTTLSMSLPSGEVIESIVNASINARGRIAATVDVTGVVEPVSYYWSSPTATGQALGSALVSDINSSGSMAGTSHPNVNTNQASLYINGQMYNLNTLIPAGSGWTLTSASSINDAGVIVGSGTLTTNGTTQTLGFSITPK